MLDATLPDTQSAIDDRHILIDEAGIRRLRIPVNIIDVGGRRNHTIAEITAGVAVPHAQRGTHMSRFVEYITVSRDNIRIAGIKDLFTNLLKRLDASSGHLHIEFDWFVTKFSPVSRIQGMLDLKSKISIQYNKTHACKIVQSLEIPVTTLCPCSKSISEYGAHNQRASIVACVQVIDPISIDALCRLLESQASCETYSILKRADEKFVTEKAYDNPKFVEDVARDAHIALKRLPNVLASSVMVESFESIHNHSAYAKIGPDL